MFQALLRRREARLFFIISILFFICIHSIDAFPAPMMINQALSHRSWASSWARPVWQPF